MPVLTDRVVDAGLGGHVRAAVGRRLGDGIQARQRPAQDPCPASRGVSAGRRQKVDRWCDPGEPVGRNRSMSIQETNLAIEAHSGRGRLRRRVDGRIVSIRRHAGSQVQTDKSDRKISELKDSTHYAGLLQRIAAKRDRAAFIEIYEYFAPRVKSFLLGQNVPPAAADDVLQEVMLAVWNKAGLFNPEKAAPSTWIFAIARNKRIDRIRRETKPELDPEEPSLQPSSPQPADDDLLHGQRKTAVFAALAELPDDQRIVIEYSFLKGLSHGEIAEQLGLPLGTVKSRIRLAFGRLRNELGELQ